MKAEGTHYRTIWIKKDDETIIQIIDQRFLPFKFIIEDISTVSQMAAAIKDMHVRGAGLIGAAAGYGMYLAMLEGAQSNDPEGSLKRAASLLIKTRPTAVNLEYAVKRQLKEIETETTLAEKIAIARQTAEKIADADAENCRQIGIHGSEIIRTIYEENGHKTVNVLTHCNAGWLAFVDYGSALSPVYQSFSEGIPIHVWVDETRPRNQGSRLTAWELVNQGIPHTIIADNTGGYLMQQGMVDLVLVGSDRTTYTGDVANKIGTYLKALAAKDNQIPFYVALPSTTIDWTQSRGLQDIPIEKRNKRELTHIEGEYNGEIVEIKLTPENSPAANYAFDVTPRELITGLITERGICKPDSKSINQLFPEHHPQHQDQ